MNLGEKIKQIRQSKAMTQSELAGDMITRNMLSRIEHGAALPSLQTVTYLAERLGVPTGFLLAEGEDESIYKKIRSIDSIKRAYELKEWAGCMELCLLVGDGDDEINLYIAKCGLEIAKESFFGGKMHRACEEFDAALEYCDNTGFDTNGIKDEIAAYFKYMHDYVSHTLFSEHIDENDFVMPYFHTPFCRFAAAYDAVNDDDEKMLARYFTAIDSLENITDEEEMYVSYIKASISLKSGDYQSALGILEKMISCDKYTLPDILFYRIIRDLEVCYREKEDYHKAYEYSNEKLSLLEKLISE